MTRYWLLKSDPEDYGWDRLAEDGETYWSGVRNAEARNHLAEMRPGDRALFQHTGRERRIVGVVQIKTAAYPDPTASDPRWLAVDIEPDYAFADPVSLSDLRGDAHWAASPLLRRPRLSVMPIRASDFERICRRGGRRRDTWSIGRTD